MSKVYVLFMMGDLDEQDAVIGVSMTEDGAYRAGFAAEYRIIDGIVDRWERGERNQKRYEIPSEVPGVMLRKYRPAETDLEEYIKVEFDNQKTFYHVEEADLLD